MARKMSEAVRRNLIYNLRFRWPKELEPYSDKAIVAMYLDFSTSEDCGDNDAKLPEWFSELPSYETNKE